jgi:hypothetical protein
MFSIKENYFTKEECEQIISYSNKLEKVYSETLFPNTNHISYFYINIDMDDDNGWIFKKLFSFIEQTTGYKIIKPLQQIHLHHYDKGNKFGIHRDDNVITQVFAVGVCLNEEYEGGEFILYNDEFIIPKKIGTTYLFNTFREHEVTEITNGERWSVIGFFHKENINFNNLI